MNALRCNIDSRKANCSHWKIITGTKNNTVLVFQAQEYKTVNKQPLLYCRFAHMGAGLSYVPVTSWSMLRTTLTEALESYNDLYPAMNLVLFEDAMQHV